MLDEALEVLQRAMASAVDQREIALLCYYDQGNSSKLITWLSTNLLISRSKKIPHEEKRFSVSNLEHFKAIFVGEKATYLRVDRSALKSLYPSSNCRFDVKFSSF